MRPRSTRSATRARNSGVGALRRVAAALPARLLGLAFAVGAGVALLTAGSGAHAPSGTHDTPPPWRRPPGP
ncbi:MAG: hypothetical protein ACK56F_32560 [bacterium]